MSSINLLPKDPKIKKELEKQKRDIFLIFLFIFFVSVFVVGGVYFQKVNTQKEMEKTDLKLEELDKKIMRSINSKKYPVMEERVEQVSNILKHHRYYSNAFQFINTIINNDVYLDSLDISQNKKTGKQENDDMIFVFSARARNYDAAVRQIAIFKNHYLINEVEVENIKIEKNQEVSFGGQLMMKKDVALYKKNYWHYGMALMSSKIDRDFKIDSFSVEPKDSLEEDSIFELKFSGLSYDEEKIANLENEFMSKFKTIIKEISICCGTCTKDKKSREKEKSCSKQNIKKEKGAGVVKFDAVITIKF